MDLHVDDVTDVTALLVLAREELAFKTANPTFTLSHTQFSHEEI